jgi:hypothetical protein
MTDYVRIKFRELRSAVDPAFVARALREGEEELEQMNYYHDVHKSRKLEQQVSHTPHPSQATSNPPIVEEKSAAPQLGSAVRSMNDEAAVVVLLEELSGAREVLGEILVSTGTTVAEARAIIDDELADVLPGIGQDEKTFEILSARGIRFLARQETRRQVLAHCLNVAAASSSEPPSFVIRQTQLPSRAVNREQTEEGRE